MEEVRVYLIGNELCCISMSHDCSIGVRKDVEKFLSSPREETRDKESARIELLLGHLRLLGANVVVVHK